MDVINSDIKKTEFIFEDYENRSNQLKDICKELRNKNKEEKFIFGLDALFYQISLFNVDYQHFRKLHSINLNRFYCNYKHISNTIILFLKTYITNKKLLETIDFLDPYPNYNSLDIYKEYDFIITKKLYDDIVKSIDLIEIHLNNKKKQLKKYSEFNEDGLNLTDFVSQYQKTVDNIEYHLNLIKTLKDKTNEKHQFYLNHTLDKIKVTYNKLKSIKINKILKKSIKCQDKLNHEEKLSQVHDELINKKN
tara:strand:- start:305 stop:1054 length:750 start_codon:yes stop_codon:yes gene_type:complete